MKSNAILKRAIELTVLDPQTGAATNGSHVAAALKTEFSISDYRARALTARAAREKRHSDFVKPTLTTDKIMLSPSEAARQSRYSRTHIARACLLGEITGAAQDGGGRWTFSRAAFDAWKNDPQFHRVGRHKKAENDLR